MPRCRGCATRSRGRKTKCSCRGFRANVRSLFCLGHLGLGKMRILPECNAVLDPIETTDMTTDETISHPTKQPEDGCQVVGYSHLTKLANYANQVIGYSHSTRLSKDDNQVVG